MSRLYLSMCVLYCTVGIMCISNYGGFKRMIKFCKTRVPPAVLEAVERLKDSAEGVKAYGIELGIQMCRRLGELGAPGLHFYTLNTSPVTIAILEGLGYSRQMHDDEKLRTATEAVPVPAPAAHVFTALTE